MTIDQRVGFVGVGAGLETLWAGAEILEANGTVRVAWIGQLRVLAKRLDLPSTFLIDHLDDQEWATQLCNEGRQVFVTRRSG